MVDLAEVAHKYAEWTAQLPRARPFYAVKCNDDPLILAQLAALGAGFDCASKGEMAAVLALGVPPSDIIFAHPAKQPSHIRYARQHGVARMTFDNEDELDKIAEHYPGAQCVLRILADDSASVCRLGLKFGAPLPRVQAILSHARALGLNVTGVSYHVGSGNGDATSFAAAVRDARQAFDIAAQLGYKLSLLDLGGGYPGSALGECAATAATAAGATATAGPAASPYASHPTFPVIAGHMRAALEAHFPPSMGVSIIGEPGRFFVKSSSTLAVCVIGKRVTAEEGEQGAPTGAQRLNYYVNDGLYGSFNCNVYDHASPQPTMALRVSGAAASGAQQAAAGSVDQAILLTPQALAELAERQAAAVAAAAAEAEERQALGGKAAQALGGHGHYSAVLHSMRHSPVSLKMGGRREMHGEAAGAGAGAAAPLLHPTTLWGPTCDSFDKISDSVRMPELKVGDWIVYENMGAYTVAGACK